MQNSITLAEENQDISEWNSSSHVIYFLTISTQESTSWFGAMEHGHMQLSDIGRIVYDEWQNTPVRRPYIHLDTFVILPNCIHMILMVRHRDTSLPTSVGVKSGTLQSIVNHFKRSSTRKCQKRGFKAFSWQEEYEGHQIKSLFDLENMRQFIGNCSQSSLQL